jgi:putative oxidoreductase
MAGIHNTRWRTRVRIGRLARMSQSFETTTAVSPTSIPEFLVRAQPWTLLAFRCAVAVLFVLHPLTSLGLLGGESWGGFLVEVSVVEIVLIVLVAVGFYARAAAFLLSGMMAFAFFVVHLPNGWNWLDNGGEPPALYSWVFLLLFVLGPGPISLDGRRDDRGGAT